jgi:hypothetical protein
MHDGEISKLKPESINLSTGVIHIEPEVSKVRAHFRYGSQPPSSFPFQPPDLRIMKTRLPVSLAATQVLG